MGWDYNIKSQRTFKNIVIKVHMQPFQILRTLIDISDKIKIVFTEFEYLFLFPRYLFSKLAKTLLFCFCDKKNREIELAPWALLVTSFQEHALFTKAKLYYYTVYSHSV